MSNSGSADEVGPLPAPSMEIDYIQNWTFYLTRPFNLFTASLWQDWYESPYMKDAVGFKMDQVLQVEISNHLVSQYRPRQQLNRLAKSYKLLLHNNPRKLEKLLNHGVEMGSRAETFLNNGQLPYKSLREALDFFNELIFYTTVLPNFPSLVLGSEEKLPRQIARLSTQLRRTSLYPAVMQKVVLPLARKLLKAITDVNYHTALTLVTRQELFSVNAAETIKKRLPFKDKRFIFQRIKGREVIKWVADTSKVTAKIDGRPSGDQAQIRGMSAYPGKVRARAHVVLDFTKPGVMKKGSILVSINSNPHLLPLIKKASALLTDEGGVTSHAAIISRELRIPCIIGTKLSTKAIKQGDMLEVDADSGIINILIDGN